MEEATTIESVVSKDTRRSTCTKQIATGTILCEICHYVFDYLDESTHGDQYGRGPVVQYSYHVDIAVLVSNAEDGCFICSETWNCFLSRKIVFDKISRAEILVWCNQYSTSDERYWIMEPRIWISEDSCKSFLFLLFRSGKMNNPSEKPNTDMEGALEFAKNNLRFCDRAHEQCYNSERFVPTRLIYLGSTHPRLVLSTSIIDTPRYATLSHCWGDSEYLRLSRSNIDEFMVAIPSEALPLTFRDAIKVAQGLGIEYLWIDSLCIIQDKDSDDWANESGRMAFVYGNSFLNIAATIAKDSNGGLFFCPRDTLPSNTVEVDARLISGVARLTCVSLNILDSYRESLPLVTRGWVVQERILAPRSIHFVGDYLFWECNDTTSFSGFLPYMTKMSESTRCPLEDFSKMAISRSNWKSIVVEYSHCNLTFKTDKLVAISGIARAAQPTQQSRYCAGIWEKDLLNWLLWRTEYSEETTLGRPISEYRGPSWSWVSVDTPIDFMFVEERKAFLHVSCRNIDIEYKGSDEYGAVRKAELNLSCEHFQLLTANSDETKELLSRMDDGYGELTLWGEVSQIRFRFDSKFEGSICILPVASRPLWLWGLLLRPTGIREGEYQRLGVFSMVSSPDHAKKMRSMRDLTSWPPGSYSEMRDGDYGLPIHDVVII